LVNLRSEEADFFDPHASGHSRCLYKLIKFKIRKSKDFFGEENNQKFMMLSQKIAIKSRI